MGCCTVVSPKHLTSFWLSFNNFDILLARKCKTHCIEIVKKNQENVGNFGLNKLYITIKYSCCCHKALYLY